MQKVLIDTDMGNDDIMAISMLLISSDVKILGISLVNGVSKIKAGSVNLQRILQYFERKIPILTFPYKPPRNSVSFPRRDTNRAENLTLLKNLEIPNFKKMKSFISLDLIFNNLRSGEKITILALGPLTNIVQIIKKYPRQIKKIIFMGGGLYKGNIPPKNLAEYNIAFDPESASKVFDSEIPVIMVGIDATRFVSTSKNFKKAVKQLTPFTKESKVIKEIILNNDGDFNYFYDPLAAALLVDYSIVTKLVQCSIKVSISAQTIPFSTKGNVSAILKVNKKRFYNLLKGVKNYDGRA